MLNANDLEQLKAKGISESKLEEQLQSFVKGFPFLEIKASASVEKGIMVIPQECGEITIKTRPPLQSIAHSSVSPVPIFIASNP